MATKCDGCGYVSKEHEEGDACLICDDGKMCVVDDEKQKEMIDWLNMMKDYAEGKKWDTGGPWVCESHPLMPHDGGYSFDCDCGGCGMPPFTCFA